MSNTTSASNTSLNNRIDEQALLFGHPTGLYTLFFAEMWERFSYYGMRALLIFYMIKGFLGYGDQQAYTVYGAYTALVYMTPFIGGMLADRILGKRICVVIGGLLMAAGHLLMTIESEWPFFFALALLICGNGFFKPNISTTVGSLYRNGDPRRDDGFNIFYTGINLGASISPLLCGYVGETYGWHYGFGLATIGMLIGLAVFVMPNLITSVLIFAGALASAAGLLLFRPDNVWAISINIFVAFCLMTAAVIACKALSRGGLPAWAGGRPEGVTGRNDWKIYLGIAIAVPVFAMLVSGFSPFTQPVGIAETKAEQLNSRVELLKKFDVQPDIITEVEKIGIDGEPKLRGKSFQFLDAEWIDSISAKGGLGAIAGVFLAEVSKPAGLVLTLLGILAFGYLIRETVRLEKIARQRMTAALILIFFQMLFFAFFEQAGSSVNNFTDRNIDRVDEVDVVTPDIVGQTIRLQPTQAQLGYTRGDEVFTLSDLDGLRKYVQPTQKTDFEISWNVTEDNIGMGIARRIDELPASIFQSFNAVFILIFALVFNWIWSTLRNRKLDPSAPVKFALGLIQLGLGFGAFYLGAQSCNEQGMVTIAWLTLGILLQTTGELCLSPVGLSTMTKLSPKVLVSTLMGAWFLATAFSQYLAAIISQFTSVGGHGGGSEGDFPSPLETVNVYGDVFKQIAFTAIASGVVCLLLAPLLTKWMHTDSVEPAE
ncbi:Dipeptide permease D [Rubripirellula tenax]|uniref:Dipeptide permease D n=1 Tax=Rubripirellula tenax TaxID=2528015 RepID=A0A5C6FIH1_9BACT|nr:peptide MFS transporter [Rubripirellula tenax]TWU60720.1 Dipeptide permease D [Rubripirellula tenax]